MTGASDEALSLPEPLVDHHVFGTFDCGEESLNRWLLSRARSNQLSGASRTHVVCHGRDEVIGYYCLSASGVTHAMATPAIRRNMPDPVPMMLLGRLAVDRNWHGRGIGSGLLKDAVLRTATMSETAGIRGLLVHAISEEAKRFYSAWDFKESPANPMTLMVRLSDIVPIVRAIG